MSRQMTIRRSGIEETRIRQGDKSKLLDALGNAGFTLGKKSAGRGEDHSRRLRLWRQNEVSDAYLNVEIKKGMLEGTMEGGYHVIVSVTHTCTGHELREPIIELEQEMPGKAYYANTCDDAPTGFMTVLSPVNIAALQSGFTQEPVSCRKIGSFDLENLAMSGDGNLLILEHNPDKKMKAVLVFSRIFGDAEGFVKEMMKAAAFVVKAITGNNAEQISAATGLIAEKRYEDEPIEGDYD